MHSIHIETTVRADADTAWTRWNGMEHISHWAFASEDWGATPIHNDVVEGGTFSTRMAAKDGSEAFDFNGTYTTVVPGSSLAYVLDDGRKVSVRFEETGDGSTRISQEFEPEQENSEEMQRAGWQAFLDNFKKYVEQDAA